MSLLFFDGFDDYGVSGQDIDVPMLTSGYAISGRAFSSDITPNGTGRSLRKINSSGNGEFHTFLPVGGDIEELIVGFHTNQPDVNAGIIITFYNENLLGSFREQVRLTMNGQRGLTLNLGSTVFTASDPAIFFPNVWYYVEVKIDHTNKQIIVRLNGEEVIAADVTLAYGSTNVIRFNGKDDLSGTSKYYDNLYCIDAAVGGAPFNDFLGESYVFTSRPEADASDNEFTMQGGEGTDHYTTVDDDFITDGDYLYTSTAALQEWFDIVDVPADTLEVYAVGLMTRTRKDNGAASYKALARLGATEATLPTHAISNTFNGILDIMEEKPGGGSWTIADANDLEIGFESVDPA